MAEILINGVRQGWGDIEFNILGRLVTGITEFNLNIKQDKGNEMGQGREPVHRSRGSKEYSADCKMYKYETDAIQDQLPAGKDLTDVAPFTAIIVYTPIGDDRLRKITIPMTEFIEIKHGAKTGDKNLEVPLSLIIGKPVFK